MFTGIVTDVGEVVEMQRGAEKLRLTVACRYDVATVDVGASVAHAGVCLTVVEAARRGNRTAIATDVGAETLAVTTLGGWKVGDKVNLERSLKIGDELGGHMVSGHVDGVAEVVARRDFDGMAHFTFRAPAALAKFIAVKGSVALDGVSLTVNAVDGDRVRGAADPAHARSDDAERLEGRRPRQHRGRPDGPLRGAADRGGRICGVNAPRPFPREGEGGRRSRSDGVWKAARRRCRIRLRRPCNSSVSLGPGPHLIRHAARGALPLGGRALTARTAARRLRASPAV